MAAQGRTQSYYKGMPVPWYFHDESAQAFAAMEMKHDDVVMSSLGKGGTTWVNKILYCLLHGYDDEGNEIPDASPLGKNGQLYPEALPMDEPAEERFAFGKHYVKELLDMPSPRMISTHLAGEHLPAKLIAPDGTGRLVLVMRNLKDMLASMYFFMGVAKDGWTGNDNGRGCLYRNIDPLGDGSYQWNNAHTIARNQKIVDAMGPRVLCVYYEALIDDTEGGVRRIADFLGLQPTEAKMKAVVDAVSFSSMKNTTNPNHISKLLLRKGGYGDWKNYTDGPGDGSGDPPSMPMDKWDLVDEMFETFLKDVPIAQPLKPYHSKE